MLNNFGYTLEKKGDLDAAMEQFTKALTINPQHAGAHNNLGLVLMRQGQLEAAYRHFSRALEINPHYEEARRNLEELERKRSSSVTSSTPNQ